MHEQIGSLVGQVPVREPGAPERMLLVHPLSITLVALLASAEKPEGCHIRFGCIPEKMSVNA